MTPSGCQSDNCTVYVKITNNSDPSLLNFHLTAVARAWVAVGFTKTPNMVCKLDRELIFCEFEH